MESVIRPIRFTTFIKMDAERSAAVAAWSAALVVTGAILTAWKDPPSGQVAGVAAALAAALWLALASLERPAPQFHWLTWLLLGCSGWGALQAWADWSVYSFETWRAASAWLGRAAIFSLAYAGFASRQRRERWKTAVIYTGGAYSVLALIQSYAGGGTVLWLFETGFESGVLGTFANADHYAALMELLLPVALTAALAQQGSTLVPAICAGTMYASVVASGSRAGAAIATAEVLLVLAVAARTHRNGLRSVKTVAASLAVCTLIGGWTMLWGRLTAGGDLFAYRREILIATGEMIRSRPLTGFGLGTWPTVYPAFAVFDPAGLYVNHAHNDWAEWTADGGAFFSALLAVFAITTALHSRRQMWAIGAAAVFLHSAIDFPMHREALAYAVFLFCGVLMAAVAGSQPEPQSGDEGQG